MKNTVIFDLDGTLLNTLSDLTDSMNYALALCGLPTISEERAKGMLGKGIEYFARMAIGKDDERIIKSVVDEFKKYYKIHSADRTAPYEGVLPLLRALKSMRVKTAIVSNKLQFAVTDLNDTMFEGLVDVAIGERDGVQRKPSPDMVFLALNSLKSSPSETLFVGDSDTDLLTAANAGLDAVAVTWGFRSREFLLSHGAKRLIDKPEELLLYLK
jgi:phosphoglycolate phosphatase